MKIRYVFIIHLENLNYYIHVRSLAGRSLRERIESPMSLQIVLHNLIFNAIFSEFTPIIFYKVSKYAKNAQIYDTKQGKIKPQKRVKQCC